MILEIKISLVSTTWNRGLLKSYFSHVLFLPLEKSFKYYERYFSYISTYFWKKNSLLKNMRNKCFARKINLCFFDVVKNGQIFLSKVCHFQYDYRWHFSREKGNIRTCKEARLKKLIKFRLSGLHSFWQFSSSLKIENNLGEVSPSHFLQDVLIETSNFCFRNF